ncbi:unnamed protein product [Thelazia callipaeda]|uniref:HDAg domain-containing protein n=1 Tax=Thelazia callipaeda TaxID=103827 RepID=A0A0N5D312_THECL|nr:unnamed protein product [Thelazia callipaeda]
MVDDVKSISDDFSSLIIAAEKWAESTTDKQREDKNSSTYPKYVPIKEMAYEMVINLCQLNYWNSSTETDTRITKKNAEKMKSTQKYSQSPAEKTKETETLVKTTTQISKLHTSLINECINELPSKIDEPQHKPQQFLNNLNERKKDTKYFKILSNAAEGCKTYTVYHSKLQDTETAMNACERKQYVCVSTNTSPTFMTQNLFDINEASEESVCKVSSMSTVKQTKCDGDKISTTSNNINSAKNNMKTTTITSRGSPIMTIYPNPAHNTSTKYVEDEKKPHIAMITENLPKLSSAEKLQKTNFENKFMPSKQSYTCSLTPKIANNNFSSRKSRRKQILIYGTPQMKCNLEYNNLTPVTPKTYLRHTFSSGAKQRQSKIPYTPNNSFKQTDDLPLTNRAARLRAEYLAKKRFMN